MRFGLGVPRFYGLGLGAAEHSPHLTGSLIGLLPNGPPCILVVFGGVACFAAVAVGGVMGCEGWCQGGLSRL